MTIYRPTVAQEMGGDHSINKAGTHVTALFSVAVGNEKSPFDYSFTFQYSGSGNPLDEAEPALKAVLGEGVTNNES